MGRLATKTQSPENQSEGGHAFISRGNQRTNESAKKSDSASLVKPNEEEATPQAKTALLAANNSNLAADAVQSNAEDNTTFDLDLKNSIAFTKVSKINIGDQEYYDLSAQLDGKKLYYSARYKKWSFTGTRSEQQTFDSKVGLQILNNINSLPKLPAGTGGYGQGTAPEVTWDIANKYKDAGGSCFASAMAKTDKAYEDQGMEAPIELNRLSLDYVISGTLQNDTETSFKIPDELLGYGVGGVLIMKGLAEAVTDKEIWEGKLTVGAPVQKWNKPLAGGASFTNGGHSTFFVEYIFDAYQNITGLYYTDNHGEKRKLDKKDAKTKGIKLYGANLKS